MLQVILLWAKRKLIKYITDLIISNWDKHFTGEPPPACITPVLMNAYRNSILLLFKNKENTPFLQVKIGTDKKFIEYCENEIKAFNKIHALNSSDLKDSVPEVVFSGLISNNYVFIKKFLPGKSIQAMLYEENSKLDKERLNKLIDRISKIHNATAEKGLLYDFTQSSYEKYLEPYINNFLSLNKLNDKESAYLNEIIQKAKSSSYKPVKIVFEHGDMNPGNILVNNDRFYFVDMAQAKLEGLPLACVLNYFIWHSLIVFPEKIKTLSLTNSLDQKNAATWFNKAVIDKIFFQKNSVSETYRNLILRYCQNMQIDHSMIKILIAFFAIRQPVYELFSLMSEKEDSLIV